MKKRLRLLFLTCLILVLVACGGDKEESKNINEENKDNEAVEEISTDAKEMKEPKGGVAAKDEEGSKKVHQDLLTSENIATKKILYENLKINEAKAIDKVNVTLESIQYAEITPSEKKSFSETGIVALTIKLKLENHSDQPLDLTTLGMFLRANDNQMSYLSQTSLEPNQQREEIAEGTSGEMLRVFIMDKEMFSVTQKLKLEFGPFRSNDGKELFSGKKAEFDIQVPN